MKSITEQDAASPPCPKSQCSVCRGSSLQHHWGLRTEGDDDMGSIILGCRHCNAIITEFDVSDPNMPAI